MLTPNQINIIKKYEDSFPIFVSDNQTLLDIKAYFSTKDKILKYQTLNYQMFINQTLKTLDKKCINALAKHYNSYVLASSIVDPLTIYINNGENKSILEEKVKYLEDAYSVVKDLINQPTEKYNNHKIIILGGKTSDLFVTSYLLTKAKYGDNVEWINYENKELIGKKYLAENYLDEIEVVVNEVFSLINKEVPLEKIAIISSEDLYTTHLTNTLSIENIPYNKNSNSLASYDCVKSLMNDLTTNFNNYQNYFDLFTDTLSNLQINEEIKSSITHVLNEFVEFDYNSFFLDEILLSFQNTKPTNKKSGIKILSSVNDIKKEEYVFYLGSYNGVLNPIYKNNSYFTEKERESFNLFSPDKIMNIDTLQVVNKLSHTSNLFTYSSKLGGYLKIHSPLVDNLEFFIKEGTTIYSDKLSNLKTGSLLDDYYAYNSTNDELYEYFNYSKDIESFTYNSYDNNFTEVSNDLLEHIQNKLSLSYSSVNTYASCPFKFYLNYQMRVGSSKSDSLVIGNLFHRALQLLCADIDNVNEERIIDAVDQAVIDVYPNSDKLTSLEKVYIDIYKQMIKSICQFNKDFVSHQMHYEGLERNYKVELKTKKYHASFTGKIDVILEMKQEDKTYQIVLDYKTGTPDYDLSQAFYGLNLQLPVYLYFLQHENKNDKLFLGAFFQQLLDNSALKFDGKKPHLEQRIIEKFKMKGLKFQYESIDNDVTTNRSFFTNQTNFVYPSDKVDNWVSFVEKKLKQFVDNICSGKFEISPIIYNGKDSPCDFCSMKDVCYMDRKNERRLPKDMDLFEKELNDSGKDGKTNDL